MISSTYEDVSGSVTSGNLIRLAAIPFILRIVSRFCQAPSDILYIRKKFFIYRYRIACNKSANTGVLPASSVTTAWRLAESYNFIESLRNRCQADCFLPFSGIRGKRSRNTELLRNRCQAEIRK